MTIYAASSSTSRQSTSLPPSYPLLLITIHVPHHHLLSLTKDHISSSKSSLIFHRERPSVIDKRSPRCKHIKLYFSINAYRLSLTKGPQWVFDMMLVFIPMLMNLFSIGVLNTYANEDTSKLYSSKTIACIKLKTWIFAVSAWTFWHWQKVTNIIVSFAATLTCSFADIFFYYSRKHSLVASIYQRIGPCVIDERSGSRDLLSLTKRHEYHRKFRYDFDTCSCVDIFFYSSCKRSTCCINTLSHRNFCPWQKLEITGSSGIDARSDSLDLLALTKGHEYHRKFRNDFDWLVLLLTSFSTPVNKSQTFELLQKWLSSRTFCHWRKIRANTVSLTSVLVACRLLILLFYRRISSKGQLSLL